MFSEDVQVHVDVFFKFQKHKFQVVTKIHQHFLATSWQFFEKSFGTFVSRHDLYEFAKY